MTRDLFKKYKMLIDTYKEEELLYTTIIFHAAPVFTGEKPSAIITFSKRGNNTFDLWEKYNWSFNKNYNVKWYELKKTSDYVVVLFYDEDLLEKVVRKNENIEFLSRFGYSCHMSLNQSLKLLKLRFGSECPHEIGLFLGYPLIDVDSFISCQGKNCLLCGYWKVYHNPAEAMKTFEVYDNAKSRVLDLIIKEQRLYNLQCGEM